MWHRSHIVALLLFHAALFLFHEALPRFSLPFLFIATLLPFPCVLVFPVLCGVVHPHSFCHRSRSPWRISSAFLLVPVSLAILICCSTVPCCSGYLWCHVPVIFPRSSWHDPSQVSWCNPLLSWYLFMRSSRFLLSLVTVLSIPCASCHYPFCSLRLLP